MVGSWELWLEGFQNSSLDRSNSWSRKYTCREKKNEEFCESEWVNTVLDASAEGRAMIRQEIEILSEREKYWWLGASMLVVGDILLAESEFLSVLL